MKTKKSTTMNISTQTRDRLTKVGIFGETYDELINRLLDERSLK